MERYIDADSLNADVIQHYTANADIYLAVRKILDDLPTADVVPRSEVEKIFEEIEEIIDEKYNRLVFKFQSYDAYEEIKAITNFRDCVSDGIVKLQKKYTEGKK